MIEDLVLWAIVIAISLVVANVAAWLFPGIK